MQNPTTEGLSLSMFESQYDAYLLTVRGAVTLHSQPSSPCSSQASLVAFSDRFHQLE
jgi:hypothetical protein